MIFVSVEIPAKIISKINKVYPSDIRSRNKIFIIGSWIGITDNPEDIMEGLLRKIRNDIISKEISIINN